jgi:hypothetical protein
MADNQINNRLTTTQKTGFVLLLVFGLLAIGLGFLQLRNTIYNPFVIHLADNGGIQNLLSNDEARLQSIDTDHDGLNDWEEINFYGTSAYLPDTDSDGISDKEEVTAGTDPLCPKGDVCESAQSIPNLPVEPITSPVGNSFVTPEDVLAKAGLTGPKGDNISNVLTTLSDPAKVRKMLVDSGQISEAQLSKIDDTTLMQMVNELITSQTGASSTEILGSINDLNKGIETVKTILPTSTKQ